MTVLGAGHHEAAFVAEAARDVVGAERVLTNPNPSFGSEDFLDFLEGGSRRLFPAGPRQQRADP